MPVAASMALKAASTGPSPEALSSTLRPLLCVRRTSARAGQLLRASVASSIRVQGPLAPPSERSTSASMSPSNSSFFLSASALKSSNTRLNSSSSSSKPSALRSEEHTSELQSLTKLVCRLLLEKKKTTRQITCTNTKKLHAIYH